MKNKTPALSVTPVPKKRIGMDGRRSQSATNLSFWSELGGDWQCDFIPPIRFFCCEEEYRLFEHKDISSRRVGYCMRGELKRRDILQIKARAGSTSCYVTYVTYHMWCSTLTPPLPPHIFLCRASPTRTPHSEWPSSAPTRSE